MSPLEQRPKVTGQTCDSRVTNPRVLKPLRFSTAILGKSEFLPANRRTGKTERIRLKTEPFATPHIPKYGKADILKLYRSPLMLIAELLLLSNPPTPRY